MKRMLHVSLDGDIKDFIPQVPDRISRISNEDNITKRICMAETIENCLSGAPIGDIKKGLRLYVYEFEVDEKYLISPMEIYLQDKVQDSVMTGEYWYTKTIKSDKVTLIEIDDFDVSFVYDPPRMIRDILGYEYHTRLFDEEIQKDAQIIDGNFLKLTLFDIVKYHEV